MVKKATVSLYGNDKGANNVLDAVENAINPRRMKVVRIPGLNVDPTDAMFKSFCNSDAIVCGISSGDKAGTEARFVARALQVNPELSGKIIFVEDFPGSSGTNDPDIKSIGRHVHLCSIMTLPQDAPERTVFLHVHAVGMPDHWLESMHNMEPDAQLLKNLTMRRRGSKEVVPTNDVIVIYVSGFKDPTMEKRILEQLLSIEVIDDDCPVIVHFRAHPGEANQPELEQAIKDRDALLKGQWEIANPEIVDADNFTHARLIGVAGVVVVHPGASEIFQMAAVRKRVVSSMSFVRPEHMATCDYTLMERYTHFVNGLEDLPRVVKAFYDLSATEGVDLLMKQTRNALPLDSEPVFGKNVVWLLSDLLE